MRVFIIGAGLVGARIVAALHAGHDLTVVDLDPAALKPLASRYDVAIAQSSATSGRELLRAGIADADLVIACTSRDEANLVAGTFARSVAPHAKSVVRTSGAEYVDVWREGRLDVDGVVSSELETARAVGDAIGMPAARHTDSFAEGRVQVLELDVPPTAGGAFVGTKLRDARLPAESRVAGVIRDRRAIPFGGDSAIEPGDRVVVVASPHGAAEWCRLVEKRHGSAVHDVVVWGAQALGLAIARGLSDRGLDVRVIEPDAVRAAMAAELLSRARVYRTDGLDPEFIQREGIGRVQAAVFAMRDDASNLFAATIARMYGVTFTIALAHRPGAEDVYDYAGIDVAVDPEMVVAEEIARFAHDPRTHQMAMIEHDRFVVLDVTVRPDSDLLHVPLRELPRRGARIGAIVRGERTLFPHGDDILEVGDRVVVFTAAERATEVERAL